VHLKHGLGMEFTACSSELMLEEVQTFTVRDAFRHSAGLA